MQSNSYKIKTVKKTVKTAKQDRRENSVKTAYKGRDKVATWKRGTDKREMYNYAQEAR